MQSEFHWQSNMAFIRRSYLCNRLVRGRVGFVRHNHRNPFWQPVSQNRRFCIMAVWQPRRNRNIRSPGFNWQHNLASVFRVGTLHRAFDNRLYLLPDNSGYPLWKTAFQVCKAGAYAFWRKDNQVTVLASKQHMVLDFRGTFLFSANVCFAH